MVKVITYGTFDLLHHGHIRLLERAKALGDYLVVGVTSDDFDKIRGKINVKQPLVERLDAVRQTGIADEVIVEEYIGQKIDDIKRLNIDIFTVGSDWVGHFDYLNDYCNVVYLERTEGVSSTELRSEGRSIRLGMIGGEDAYEQAFLMKIRRECDYANGVNASSVYLPSSSDAYSDELGIELETELDALLHGIDAVFIASHPADHSDQIRQALASGVHVLCEEPLSMNPDEVEELFDLADSMGLTLMGAIRTAFATAFDRLALLIKSGRIGRIVSVDSVCTSIREFSGSGKGDLGSVVAWGPTALLPIFTLLGNSYQSMQAAALFHDNANALDSYAKLTFDYGDAIASATVAKGAKSEGELIVTGTQGYAYVPAPWWKTDYFELRYEDQELNKRFFYQLDGEGIRNELVAFAKAIEGDPLAAKVDKGTSLAIARVVSQFNEKRNVRVMS